MDIDDKYAKPAQSALQAAFSRYDTKGGLRLVRLWQNWSMVMGPELEPLAFPLGHREGTILIGCEDSPALQELHYYGPEILERVNAFMDEPFFDKVRVELLLGRTPLNILAQHAAEQSTAPSHPMTPVPFERPEKLGGLLGIMDPATPIGRCYWTYVASRSRP